MHTELQISTTTLVPFLLALARVSGAVAFVPFPGLRSGPDMARIVFAVLMTWCLRAAWPAAPAVDPGLATITMWVMAEAACGVLMGLLVSFLTESFQLGAQILSIQAGYSYASTIDPTTQADSGVIGVVVQLMAGLCFFAVGVDREILRALAVSFEKIPPGKFLMDTHTLEASIRAGSAMFSTGLRIALPVIAFLLMVDMALALLGRMQQQLQLLSLAFPAKMLASLALLASMAAIFPTVYQSATRKTMELVGLALGG
jgi:flagellar biosynthetic protein FliR